MDMVQSLIQMYDFGIKTIFPGVKYATLTTVKKIFDAPPQLGESFQKDACKIALHLIFNSRPVMKDFKAKCSLILFNISESVGCFGVPNRNLVFVHIWGIFKVYIPTLYTN